MSPASYYMQQILRPLPKESDAEIPYTRADVRFDGVDLNAAYTAFQHNFLSSSQRAQDRQPDDPNGDEDPLAVGEQYHWRGLIAQSLFFNVIENSFRAASDDQIRILLASFQSAPDGT